jgi:eukaryotic-like serine/threonine-protein kinase
VTISTGTRLGPYEILAPLGAGGMGEVYRARDERLKRDVAIKVLPASFSADTDRLRRFEQEAQAAGRLNHPNITAVYDIGTHGGAPYVVQELLEGETLRAVMAGGTLSAKKAIDYSVQISRGLAAAHEKGIVHRDLKPENLFVTRDGRVKILDFGLAKLTRPESSGARLTEGPTVSAGTEPGVVLGTVGYMSPEQVRGQPVDIRSDIFSFGTILYEMLSGKRAFSGGSAADTMSAILREDPPDFSLTNQNVPQGLDRIVRHCLEKNPEQRLHSAHDLAFDLESVLGVSGSSPAAAGVSVMDSRVWLRRAALSLAAAATLIVAIGGARLAGYRLARSVPSKSAPGGAVRAVFAQLTLQSGIENFPSISPDGKTFLYVSAASGNADIFLQRVDGRNAINLTKDCGEEDTQPTFSPDGSQIAFRSEREGGGIFLMGATGESVRRLTDFGFNPAWSPDGKEIAVADESIRSPLTRNTTSRLWAVSVATGAKRLITDRDAVQPSWSPNGHRIAYWGLPKGGGQRDIWTIPAAGAAPGAAAVAVTNDPAVDWNPVWSPDGNFLYFSSDRNGTMNLWRVPIEEKTGKVLGDLEPVTVPSRWCGHLSIARDGRHLLYASFEETSSIQRVAFDPVRERVAGEPVSILSGSLLVRGIGPSPDGKWVAFSKRETPEDIFVISSDGSSLRQLTNDAFKDRGADWSADGKSIAFSSERTGRFECWSVNPDGSRLTQLTRRDSGLAWSPRWSPDGTRLAFPDGTNSYLFPLGRPLGAEKAQPLPRFDDAGAAFEVGSWSPNGRALAGTVNRPDGSDVPGIVLYWLESKKYQRVTDFGGGPAWMSDSRRLLFVDASRRKILVLDTASGKSVPLLDISSGTVRGKVGISRDDRTIFFVRDHMEADIWQVTLR